MSPAADRIPDACFPGFEHVRRYYDARIESFVANIDPGEFYVTSRSELISTVLGSCVSACVWSPRLAIGGMNHFMLPEDDMGPSDVWTKLDARSASTRYGGNAMDRLINELIKHGAPRSDLRVKLVGGGRMWVSRSDVGERNVEFAKAYVAREHLRLEGMDVGEMFARRVLFDPRTGRARVRKLDQRRAGDLRARESTYQKAIATKPVVGDVELF